jgi:hypothetical protein
MSAKLQACSVELKRNPRGNTMHKKAGVEGRGVVLAGRVHEGCGDSQQLSWLDRISKKGKETATKIK